MRDTMNTFSTGFQRRRSISSNNQMELKDYNIMYTFGKQAVYNIMLLLYEPRHNNNIQSIS